MEQFTDALIIEQLVKTSNPGVTLLRFVTYDGVNKKNAQVSFNRESKKWDLNINNVITSFLDLDFVLQFLHQNGYVDSEWIENVYAKIDKIYFSNVPISELEVTQKAKSSFWDHMVNSLKKPKLEIKTLDLSGISNDVKAPVEKPVVRTSGLE